MRWKAQKHWRSQSLEEGRATVVDAKPNCHSGLSVEAPRPAAQSLLKLRPAGHHHPFFTTLIAHLILANRKDESQVEKEESPSLEA